MTTNPHGKVIPIFPCKSIDEQTAFYQALGFELTYRQAKPNVYVCFRHRIAELHFFLLKGLEPSDSYSSCYVSVPDVDDVFREFREGLKKACGKIPVQGFPRIGKLNDLTEDRRFNLVDPAGNYLRIGQSHAAPRPISDERNEGGLPSRFAAAYETAYRLAYAKEDPAQAAKVLDLVFKKAEEASAALRYKACALRADIADAMDEPIVAEKYIREAERLPLSAREMEEAAVTAAAERLEELKSAWRQPGS